MAIVDLKSIFLTLDHYSVKYILVGALGAVAYGARLCTSDIDICIATDGRNLQQTAAALKQMHARLIREPTGRAMGSVSMDDWTTLRLDDPSEHHLFAT